MTPTENTEEGKTAEIKLPTLDDMLRSDSDLIKYDEKEIENRKITGTDYISNPNNQFYPILDKDEKECFISRTILSKLNENKEKIKEEFPIKNHLNNEIIIKKENIPEEKDDNKNIGILVSNDDNNKYLIKLATVKKYLKKLPEGTDVECKDLSTNEKTKINFMKCNFEKIDIESQLNEFDKKLKEQSEEKEIEEEDKIEKIKEEKNEEVKEDEKKDEVEEVKEEEKNEEDKIEKVKEEKNDEVKEEEKNEEDKIEKVKEEKNEEVKEEEIRKDVKQEIKEEIKEEIKNLSGDNENINVSLNINEQLKKDKKKKAESKEITQEDLNLIRGNSNDKPIIIRRAVYKVIS